MTVEWPGEQTIDVLKNWGATDVIEVGPGAGALTIPLLKAGVHVTALERDSRFVEYLTAQKDLYPDHFNIVNEDVLHFDLKAWLSARQGRRCAVVGNMPYHISTPIVEWVLPNLSGLVGVVFLTQYEFAKRLAAETRTKDYSSLSVFVQLRSQPKFLAKVPKELFKPQPKVDSGLIALEPHPAPTDPVILRKVEKVCRAAFAQRRKQLANGVKAFLSARDKNECPIGLHMRPEELTPEQFIELALFLFPD